MKKNLKEIIKKAKEDYRKIGHIECPAFNGEKVYFTNKGFNHLIKKDRKYRDYEEQIRRFNLLEHVVDILITSKVFNTVRYTKKQFETSKGTIVSNAIFWSFNKKIKDREIIVVVCQINNEPKIFISIMDKTN